MRRTGRPRGDLLAQAFGFAAWATAQAKPPTREQVQTFLQCSGTKAAIWRRRWLESLRPPVHQAGGKRPSITKGNTDETA